MVVCQGKLEQPIVFSKLGRLCCQECQSSQQYSDKVPVAHRQVAALVYTPPNVKDNDTLNIIQKCINISDEIKGIIQVVDARLCPLCFAKCQWERLE